MFIIMILMSTVFTVSVIPNTSAEVPIPYPIFTNVNMNNRSVINVTYTFENVSEFYVYTYENNTYNVHHWNNVTNEMVYYNNVTNIYTYWNNNTEQLFYFYNTTNNNTFIYNTTNDNFYWYNSTEQMFYWTNNTVENDYWNNLTVENVYWNNLTVDNIYWNNITDIPDWLTEELFTQLYDEHVLMLISLDTVKLQNDELKLLIEQLQAQNELLISMTENNTVVKNEYTNPTFVSLWILIVLVIIGIVIVIIRTKKEDDEENGD